MLTAFFGHCHPGVACFGMHLNAESVEFVSSGLLCCASSAFAGEARSALADRVGEWRKRRPPPGFEFAVLTQIPCAPLTPAKAEEVEERCARLMPSRHRGSA